jgi:hypothetical protein
LGNGEPAMLIGGHDKTLKKTVSILDDLGCETADMGRMEAAHRGSSASALIADVMQLISRDRSHGARLDFSAGSWSSRSVSISAGRGQFVSLSKRETPPAKAGKTRIRFWAGLCFV